MTKIATRSAAFCALLATTAMCGLTAQPALAQTLADTERQAPDENGVDVISGKLNVPVRSITAGRAAEGGLTYANGWAGGEYFDSFKVEVGGFGGAVTTITIYGTEKRFTDNGDGTWANADGDGATFVFDAGINGYIYTDRSGAVFKFLKSLGDTGFLPVVTARLSTITRADGEVITYHHRIEAGSRRCTTRDDCVNVAGGGRVQSITNNLGHQLKAGYASDTWETDGSGNDEFHRLTKVIAINNAVDYCTPGANSCTGLTQSWPELTRAETVSGATTTHTFTDQLSQTTHVETGASGVNSVRSPASATNDLTVAYDADNRVATWSSGGGNWGYSYADSAGQRTTTVTQPLGGSKVYVSDLNLKRVLSFTDELGRTTGFTYDSYGRRTRVTAPEGNYAQTTLDARGNATEVRAVAKAGTGLADIVTSASFDASCANPKTCNQPNSVTDARGSTTDYTYDATHGGLLTATAPAPTGGAARPQTRLSYSSMSAYYKNNAGSIVAAPSAVYRLTATSACQTAGSCAGTADEVKTSIAYGSAGVANNLLATGTSSGDGTGALTATVTQTHDAFGNVLTVDGPLAGTDDTVRFRYDALRRPVGTVSPDPDGAGALKHRARKITYDADGNVTKAESGTVNSQSDSDWAAFAGLEAVETGYDTLGRPVTRKLTSGATIYALTQTSYDAAGRPLCTARRMNPGEFASPPASACDLGAQGSFGPDRITKAIYDNASQVTQVKTALGTAEEANEVTSTYSSNGQAATVMDAESNKTTYEYDGHDRLSKTRYPDTTKGAGTSSTTDYEQLTYDAGSNVTAFRNRANETIAYSHNALSRLTFKDLPGSEPDVTYGYDLLGRMTGASQPGHALSFTFDALGRQLTQVGPHGTVISTVDIAGRRTRITHPDSFYVDQDYLVTGEMSAIRENGATSGVGVLATFAYDDLGRRTSLTRGNGTSASYTFDAVSRLSQLADDVSGTTYDQTLSFSYNPASQIASTTRSNDLFAWAGHGSGTTNSTANGLNQISVHGGTSTSHDSRGNMTADGLGKTFGYTSENLLTSASGSVTAAYDLAMRLYQVAGAATTRFGYDGTNAIAEYEGSNSLQRRFVFGSGVDEPIIWYEGSGTSDRRFLHADERGSVVAVSNSAGAVTNVNTYDEYGKPGSANVGRFQYTGQKWIAELGLYDYKARMYHPGLPRFTQTDPIGYGGGMNRYVYPTDPVNFTDPMGLTVQEIVVTAQRGIVVTGTRLPFCDRSANMLLSVCGGGGWQGNERPNFGLTDRGDADSGERRSPQNNNCAPAISSKEASAARAGDRNGFWGSRASRGDPLAGTALSIVNNSSDLGMIANMRLRDAITTRSPGASFGAVSAEVQQIGVQLMRAHVNAVNTFGSPSASQIAAYHYQVFGAHGLPNTTFGGSPITGTGAEATLTSPIWMGCP